MARTHRLQLREWRATEETPPPVRQVDAPGANEEDTLAGRPDLTRELERILSEGGMLAPRQSSSWWKRMRDLVYERLDGRHRSGS